MRLLKTLPMSLCFVLVALSTLVVGCASGQSERSTFSKRERDVAQRRLGNITVAEVKTAADRAFKLHFRVDQEESTDTVWVSRPEEVDERGRRVRDVLGSPNRHRRIGEMYLMQEGADVVVGCRVRIERLDSSERAAFANMRVSEGDDRPSETPIDRAGPSSTSSREEWVNVRRDRETERALLDTIRDTLAPSTQPE